MNSNIEEKLAELKRFGFYGKDALRQNGAEIQTALTTQSIKVLKFLAESEEWSVKAAVTMNPFCTCQNIRNFISEIMGRQKLNDSDIKFMKLVSQNPKCSGDILDDIARTFVRLDDWRYLRDKMSNLPNMEDDTLLYLLGENEDFAVHIARTTERQEILIYGPEEYVIENPNCPTELLESIAKSYPSNCRIASKIAANPNADEKTLDALAKLGIDALQRPEWYEGRYREAVDTLKNVANNPTTTAETLTHIWKHGSLPCDSEVLIAMVNNENTPSLIKDTLKPWMKALTK